MKALIVTCVLMASLALTVQGDDSEITAPTFDKFIFRNTAKAQRMFVMFYAPWCGHCKRLSPTWDELAKKYNTVEDNKVIIGKMDCTVEKEICAEEGVRGYPTMKFFSLSGEPEKYTRQRTVEDLSAFIEEQLAKEEADQAEPEAEEPEAPTAAVEDGLYLLTAADFDSHIKRGNHFVKFFAPWCGHCQRMAQAWKDLASAMKDSKKVTIAEVDCTKHSSTCSKNGVRGYPTIMWFTDGQKNEDYRSGRSLGDLQEYVNKMIGSEMEEKKLSEDGKVPEPEEKVVEAADKEAVESGEDALVVLEPTDFDDTIAEDYSLVMFVEHANAGCETALTEMEKLAKKNQDADLVLYGVMDCTVNINMCTLLEIEGPYPAFYFYHNGAMVEKYTGDISIEAIEEYVTGKVKALEGVKEKQNEEKEQKKAPKDHGGEL